MAEVKHPRKQPDETHHVLIKLETVHVDAPDVDLAPLTHELIEYHYTPPDDHQLLAARIRDASILIITTSPINASTLGEAPYL